MILPDTDTEGARVPAECIRSEVADHPYVFPDNEIPYTLSTGVAIYRGSPPTGRAAIVKRSDDALYASKNAGKNRVTLK